LLANHKRATKTGKVTRLNCLNGLLGRDSVRRVRLFCAFRPSGFPVLFPFSHFSAQLKLGWGEAVLFAVEVAAVLAAA